MRFHQPGSVLDYGKCGESSVDRFKCFVLNKPRNPFELNSHMICLQFCNLWNPSFSQQCIRGLLSFRTLDCVSRQKGTSISEEWPLRQTMKKEISSGMFASHPRRQWPNDLSLFHAWNDTVELQSDHWSKILLIHLFCFSDPKSVC